MTNKIGEQILEVPYRFCPGATVLTGISPVPRSSVCAPQATGVQLSFQNMFGLFAGG